MFEAMMDFMKPEIDAKIDEMIDQNKLESIKNIMDSLKMTPQQAMDALKIPVTEQSKYQSRL